MHESLELVSELSSDDIKWILDHGTEKQVISGTVIIQEGDQPSDLIFVLDGLVGVRREGVNHEETKLGPGELLEVASFVEKGPASASVRAIENTLLLGVPRQALYSKLEQDRSFASRLYRACAVAAARSWRERVQAPALSKPSRAPRDNGSAQAWAAFSEVIEPLKRLLRRADREAIRNKGVVPQQLQEEIGKGFQTVIVLLNDRLGNGSELSEEERSELGARVQEEILPYLLLTNNAERWYSKPRGYAGDFLTIDGMYRNEPQGTGRLGPLVDAFFLNAPAAQAVRNRRILMGEHIRNALERAQGRPAHVTSMACGPAAEIFDIYAQLEDPARMRATLIDIDLEAVEFVKDKCQRLRLTGHVETVSANLVYLVAGRQKLPLRDQDLVYSIGLIDYFSDKFVVGLLNYVHGLLRPGGKVVLGNFEPRNPNKALMDHIFEWKLIHRSEDDMNRLFQASRFGRICTDIRYEAARVNLFAECVRGD